MSQLGTIQAGTEVPELTVSAATPGATVTISVANNTGTQMFTWTAGQTETVNISGTHPAGKKIIFQIANDATLPRVITLGTGIVSIGVITGIVSKVSTIEFISNGTSFYELARTVGL